MVNASDDTFNNEVQDGGGDEIVDDNEDADDGEYDVLSNEICGAV